MTLTPTLDPGEEIWQYFFFLISMKFPQLNVKVTHFVYMTSKILYIAIVSDDTVIQGW